jgi:hypothetical protein
VNKALARANEFIAHLDSTTPEIERFLRYVPFVGSPIANLMRGFRMRPVVMKIERELRNRRPPDLDVWGESVEKALFAQSICELTMLEMGWPNDHFLPSDPAAIVFWNHRDGLDFATTIKDIESNLGIDIDSHDIEQWFDKPFGDVVDALWAEQIKILKEKPWPPAPNPR